VEPSRDSARPAQPGLASNPHERGPGNRLDHPEQLGRPKDPSVLDEAGDEIDDLERPTGGLESRLEDVGVLEVALPPRGRVDGAHGKEPAVVGVQQGAENRL
jgi:hypothetical protein